MKNIGQHTTFITLLALLSLVFEISAQENNGLQNILGKLTTYTNTTAQEKVYMQTDKDFYTTGETIWLKTYNLDGITHTSSTLSKVIYVELVDSKDNIITQQKLYTESSGAASDITLPKEMEEGTYILRAYTKYMLNDVEPVLFQKEIPISASPNKVNDEAAITQQKTGRKDKSPKPEADKVEQTKPIVQFFPEGGELIADIECVLGAKITDSDGNGLALKGKILDQDGLLISLFDSYEFGLGWSSLKAKPDTDYYLQIPFDGKMVIYPVPKPLEKGYALRIMNRGEHIMISASTNSTNGLQGALLIGHIRGNIIFKQELQPNTENSITIKLLTSKLPDGIAHFTLFAPNGEPVSERLTFIENPKNDLKLSVKTDATDYGLREKVNLNLALADHKGKPLMGDLSMSVFTQNEMHQDADNIKSWLLLNSDLGGTIANPSFFFQEDVKGRAYLLDLLMLTHGWRRFTWKSIIKDSVQKEVSFPPERGIMINGAVTAYNNKYQPKKAAATLNIVTKELIQEQKLTNAQGRFSFGPFIFEDSVTTVISAKNIPISKKNKDRLAIHLDPYFPEVTVKNRRKSEMRTKEIMSIPQKPYPSAVEQETTPDFEYDPDVTYLDEAVVKDTKKETSQELLTKKMNARTLHGEATIRLIPDSIPGVGPGSPTFDILRYAGVQVFGTFPNQTASIRLEGVLFILDGIRTSSAVIQTIPISNILFIDVLKGADATIYGGLGPGRIGGAIAVYTKTGDEIQQTTKELYGVSNAVIPGFHKTRDFYKPNYEITIPKHDKPDYRRTLHWDPDIKLNNEISTELDFFTGDTSGKYIVRIEGITYDGRPVSKLHNFNVVDPD